MLNFVVFETHVFSLVKSSVQRPFRLLLLLLQLGSINKFSVCFVTHKNNTHAHLSMIPLRTWDWSWWLVCVFVCLWLCALIFALCLFLIANMTFLFVLLVCLKFYYLLLYLWAHTMTMVTQTRMFNFNCCFRNGAAAWKKTFFYFKFWKHLSSLIVPHLVLV